MASNNIARLGVVLGLDTATWSADIDKAISENRKLGMEIKRATNAAAAEIINLKYATEDYGKEVSKVAQIEREIQAGRFTGAHQETLNQLRQAAKAYDEIAVKSKTATTGGLTPQQQQALAYQTTDLVTQIASGQNAMIALLQQGGQLKDQFGGFANTFKILSSVITPFRIAIGGIVTVLGTLGLAFYKGSEESKRLRDDMILTGNYADMSQKKFLDLSAVVSQKLNVSIGEAKTVFTQLIASGQFTSKSIGAVGEAILRVAELSGKSADQVAQELIPAFNGSASSAKNLNDKMHLLTLEQYKQIEALDKQSKAQESATILADALNDKLSAQERQIGTLEKIWKSITTTASAAWDALLGIGRAESPEERIEKLTKQINKMAMTLQSANPDSVYTDKLRQNMLERLQELADLQEAQRKKSAEEQAAREQTDLINDYAKNGQKRRQLEGEIADQLAKDRFEKLRLSSNTEQQINIEAQAKGAQLARETARRNIEEAGVFSVENAKLLSAKLQEVEIERLEKLRQLRIASQAISYEESKREQIDEARETQKRFDEILAGYNKQAYAQNLAIKDEAELLELKSSMVGATEKEMAVAESRLELAKKIREIEADWMLSPAEKKSLQDRLMNTQAIKENNLEMIESIKKVQDMYTSVFDNMMTAIEKFVRTGKTSFSDLARSIIQDILMIQIRAQSSQLFSMFLGSIGFGGARTTETGGIDYSFAGMKSNFGGPRAGGGPIQSGQSYLVGERGPELFIPRSSGTIVPNNTMQSMGVTNVTNNYIQAIDTKSFEDRIFGSSRAVWAAGQYAQKSLAVQTGRM